MGAQRNNLNGDWSWCGSMGNSSHQLLYSMHIYCEMWPTISSYNSSHLECFDHFFLTFLILALPILTNLPGLLFSPDLSRPFTTYASPTHSWTPLGIEGSSSRLPHEVQYWSHSLAQSVASDESWVSRWKTCVNFGEQNFETPKLIQENATPRPCCGLGEALRGGQGLEMRMNHIFVTTSINFIHYDTILIHILCIDLIKMAGTYQIWQS